MENKLPAYLYLLKTGNSNDVSCPPQEEASNTDQAKTTKDGRDDEKGSAATLLIREATSVSSFVKPLNPEMKIPMKPTFRVDQKELLCVSSHKN